MAIIFSIFIKSDIMYGELYTSGKLPIRCSGNVNFPPIFYRNSIPISRDAHLVRCRVSGGTASQRDLISIHDVGRTGLHGYS